MKTQQGFAGTVVICVIAAVLIFLVSYSLGQNNPKAADVKNTQRTNIEIKQ